MIDVDEDEHDEWLYLDPSWNDDDPDKIVNAKPLFGMEPGTVELDPVRSRATEEPDGTWLVTYVVTFRARS